MSPRLHTVRNAWVIVGCVLTAACGRIAYDPLQVVDMSSVDGSFVPDDSGANADAEAGLDATVDAAFDADETPDAFVEMDAMTPIDMGGPTDDAAGDLDADFTPDTPDMLVEPASLVVLPTFGLITSESGTSATFEIQLESLPTGDVFLLVASVDETEATISPGVLTFTPANWNVAQTVTVTGVDDSVADGDQAFDISVHVAASTDARYAALADSLVMGTNTDDDMVGIVVSPTSVAPVEGGAAATFDVVLRSQPTANVVLPLHIVDAGQGSVAPASLTFTTTDWFVPQSVSVTSIDDFAADGDVMNEVVTDASTSSDASYNGIDPDNVLVTHIDNDMPNVVVTPVAGLVTTEGAGFDTFSVSLTSLPLADVTITVMTSDVTEGSADVSSLTFTSSDWSVPQIVTVTGANDAVDDGNVAYTIVLSTTASADLNYNGLNVLDVSVTNTDDDIAGVGVTPTTGLVTTERAATAMFSIVLQSQPLADVSISIASSNVNEGVPNVASVTFTPLNWNTPQSIVVTGVDELVLDADVAYAIQTGAATSADGVYSGMPVADVALTNWTVPDYLKASNTEAGDGFGSTVAVSADGTTIAVAAHSEDSAATGINGLQSSNAASSSGAVYVFVRSGDTWVQQAYVKASNTAASDFFAHSLALSADGNTMVVGAYGEDSNATGINGNQSNNGSSFAGAAYVFVRSAGTWSQEAYLKASNTGSSDQFGISLALSNDGNTLAVAAIHEASNALGVGGNQADNSTFNAGAVYVFVRGGSVWTQQAYVKRTVATGSLFGSALDISGDGNTLAVSMSMSASVYIYTRSGTVWSAQTQIVEASGGAPFDCGITLSLDGNRLIVGDWSVGTVRVYGRSAGIWTEDTALFISRLPGFGISPSISDDGMNLMLAQIDNSNATRLNGDDTNSLAMSSGAARSYSLSTGAPVQTFYVKASNTGIGDGFGSFYGTAQSDSIQISGNAAVYVLGAYNEGSAATGVGGDQTSNAAANSGAVYVYR